MSEETVKKILERVQSVPPLPAAVQQLCRMVDDPRATVPQISKVISSDPALTARLLRVANSTFYGLAGKVATISHAIMVLGAQQVRNLALGVAIFGTRFQPDHKPPIKREEYWRHSLAVAVMSRLVAAEMKIRGAEETFVSGLLHDIGKLVFLEYLPNEYTHLLQTKKETGRPLYELEKEFLGMDHQEVGGELCKYWRIPDALTEVVANHHQSTFDDDPMSAKNQAIRVIQTADDLVKISGIGNAGEFNVNLELCTTLNVEELPAGSPRKLLGALPKEVSEMEQFFNLPPTKETLPSGRGDMPPIAVLLEDPYERDIAELAISALGFPTTQSKNLTADGPTAAVVDSSLSDDWGKMLKKRNVPILDYAAWRSKNFPDSGFMAVDRFRDWVEKNLGE